MKILLLYILSLNLIASTRDFANQINQLNSFKADFSQILYDQNKNIINQDKGVLYIKRPNKFKWILNSVNKQEIVSDGVNIWILDYNLNQVSIYAFDTFIQSSPFKIIVNPTDANLNQYDIVKKKSRFFIKDKKNIGFSYEVLFINNKIKELSLNEHGNLNRIILENYKEVDISKDSFFKPSISKKMSILDQR